MKAHHSSVGRVPPRGVPMPEHGAGMANTTDAASGDAAYTTTSSRVGRVPSHGVPVPVRGAGGLDTTDAASGDTAYTTMPFVVGRVPPRGGDGHLKKMGAMWN